MAVRTPHFWFSGEVGSDDDLNSMPKGWIAKVTLTDDDFANPGEAQMMSRSVTVPANRTLKISTSIRLSAEDSGTFVSATLRRDGSLVGFIGRFVSASADDEVLQSSIIWDDPGPADTYLYSVGLIRTSGTGLVWMRADASGPFWFTIEDCGSST